MRRAEPLAGLGGAALFVSLFLTWYRADAVVPDDETGVYIYASGGDSTSAWSFFTAIDVELAVLAALFLAVPLTSLLTRGPAKAIGTAVLASAFGWIAVLLVAFRLLFPPFPDFDGVTISTAAGGFVALAGAIVGWVGSWLSMRDESTPGAKAPVVPILDA